MDIIHNLIRRESEEEWFEFKENWFEPHAIGEYISSMSNAAALAGQESAYFIWGVHDITHEIVGTKINYQKDFKKEPFQHYLSRQTIPDIGFSFHDETIEGKRIVVLDIPAAKRIPTSFDGIRYIRIGSSKENLIKYPERESQLFSVLKNGLPSIVNTESEYQSLTFQRLFTYYAGKGIELRQETFKQNLNLLTENGKYNIQAQLLSDDCHMPIRISIFRGKTKADPLFSVREFGNTCILLALDKVLEYGDVINLVQVDERHRLVERTDVSLFNQDAYREAVINAFVHNKWIDGNAPMITVYSDRVEILSHGSLAPKQTIDGFYLGVSIPVNQKLSDIFLQLHISERSGRGVPKITELYGKEAYDFHDNSISVSLQFARVDETETHSEEIAEDRVSHKVGHKVSQKKDTLNESRERIILEIRNNPNLTQTQLMDILNLSRAAIQKNIAWLKSNGYLERIGSNKLGYWHVIEREDIDPCLKR